MKKMIFLMALLTVSAFALGAHAQSDTATAALKDVAGHDVGIARFTQENDGKVRLEVSVKGIPPGTHGIHIHQKGSCSPTFAAAGDHFNPGGKHHGLSNMYGPHAGDLPNLEVNKAGEGYLKTTMDRVTLSPGVTSLLSGNGTALVIHAKPDDQKTDPSGNSGDRIVCGVIKAG